MILLPIVLLARAVLLVHQLRSEREERAHANDPPAWAPGAGRRPVVAMLVSRNLETQPPDAACLLDPGAMARGGGRLTLWDHDASGLWGAYWSGHRTMRTREQVDTPEPDPAPCAAKATVQALVDTLAGRDPAREVSPARAGLNIHAVLPEQPR